MIANTLARRTLAVLALVTVALCSSAADDPSIKVASMDAVGPRPVEKQTQTSVVRDYLLAWQKMTDALQNNRVDVLDESFVGSAKERLGDTVRDQQNMGIQTIYGKQSHDLQVVFYSPEGLSLEMVDHAGYEVEVRDHGKVVGTQRVQSRYVAVLTPTESRWKVRVLQGGTE